MVDVADGSGPPSLAWPVVGNFPGGLADASRFERTAGSVKVDEHPPWNPHRCRDHAAGCRRSGGALDGHRGEPVGHGANDRVVPYLEWVLNRPDADRGHTQYNRLFAEMEYVGGLHAVLAWDKHARAMGLLASDRTPQGFLTSRIDFIGRARSVWRPRVLETLDFESRVIRRRMRPWTRSGACSSA